MGIGDLFIPLEYLLGAALLLVAAAAMIAARRGADVHAGDDALLREAASTRGWQLVVRRSGRRTAYHFTGAGDDVRWELDSVLAHESTDSVAPARAYTRWRSASARTDGGVIEGWPEVGRPLHQGVRLDPANPVEKLLPGLVGEALELKKGRTAPLVEVQSVDGIPAALTQRIRFLATPGLDVRPFLGEPSVRAIAEYFEWSGTREGQLTPGAPLTLILLSGDGLTILTHGTTADPDVVERIVRLGTALATGYRPTVPAAEPLQD
ncbi:MAG TPA: hypothetical protein VJ596_12695 [Gemmatimonadaceae bacterium]|nr:hypothetical protein [Gemmatimonadaceae bacterium]